MALDSTDFTDVAAVVITTADSRSGILALLKRTGFHLPVFMLADEPVSSACRRYSGNSRERAGMAGAGKRCLSLRSGTSAALYGTLTQYVDMGNSTFACPGHQHGEFLENIPQAAIFMTFW